MDKEFVPYELSVKLKELGFDEPCLYYFNKQENNLLWQDLYSGYYRNSKVSRGNLLWGDTYDNGNVSAPLWQQAFKFIISIVNLEFDYNKEYVIGFYGEFYLELHKWEDYEGVNIQPVCEGNNKTLDYLIKLADKNK